MVQVRADHDRWIRESDPERRELRLSLGAALTNLIVAARGRGLASEVRVRDAQAGIVEVRLRRGRERGAEPLLPALLQRRTNRQAFEPTALPQQDVMALRDAARAEGIHLVLVDVTPGRRRITELVSASVRAEIESPDHLRALGRWLRDDESPEGLTAAALGLYGPRRFALPVLRRPRLAWLANRVGLSRAIAKEAARLAASASLWGVLIAEHSDATLHITGGMAFEHLHLEATRRGIALQPMSQPLQLAAYRDELRRLLGLGREEALMLFRLGYGPPAPSSARRAVAEVLESPSYGDAGAGR